MVVDEHSNGAEGKPQGKLTFSEDGSTIFAAFGSATSGTVAVIDGASGAVIPNPGGFMEWGIESHRSSLFELDCVVRGYPGIRCCK